MKKGENEDGRTLSLSGIQQFPHTQSYATKPGDGTRFTAHYEAGSLSLTGEPKSSGK